MQVDARDFVLVDIGDTDISIAENPSVGILVLLGGEDLRRDVLLVLDDGALVGRGRHAALLESCALYREMWQAHIGAKDGDME